MSSSCKVIAIVIYLSASVFAGGSFLTTCSSLKTIKYDKLNVAVISQLISYNAYHVAYQAWLEKRLLEDGYRVAERSDLERILGELGFDRSGMIKGNDSIARENTSEINLKKLGELLGVNVILYFSVWKDERVVVRLVDCEKGEVILIAIVEGEEGLGLNFGDVTSQAIADMIRLSIFENKKKIVGKVGTLSNPDLTNMKRKGEYTIMRGSAIYGYNFDK